MAINENCGSYKMKDVGAVGWLAACLHCQVRSCREHPVLYAVNYARVWSTAITLEGHLFLSHERAKHSTDLIYFVSTGAFIFVVALQHN